MSGILFLLRSLRVSGREKEIRQSKLVSPGKIEITEAGRFIYIGEIIFNRPLIVSRDAYSSR